MRTLLVLVGVAALGGLLATPAAANLPVSFSFPRRTIVQVDADLEGVGWTRVHVASAGETLPTLAAALLGDKARAAEIAALNPSNFVEDVAAGTRLIVPPAMVLASSGAAPTMWTLCAYASPGSFAEDGDLGFQPIEPGAELPDNRRGVHLVALRTDLLPAFWRRVAAAREEVLHGATPTAASPSLDNAWRAVLAALAREQADGVALAATALGGRTPAKEGDPVHTIRERWRVTGLAGGVLGLERTSHRLFDKDGKELSPQAVEKTKEKLDLWLLVLGLAGIVALLLVARRRLHTAGAAAR